MDLLGIATLLSVLRYATTQDANCDFVQNVGATQRYRITNPNYPNSYPRGITCRYIINCPQGYNCRMDCSLYLPQTPGCSGDQFLVSRSGDALLTSAERYCGRGTLSNVVSTENRLSVGVIVSANSAGGGYDCEVSAQQVVNPTPMCRCGERRMTRIVGGQETRPYEFTMMAGLIEVSIDSILCGGVIISERYIMTAAHCLQGMQPSGIVVTVGDYDISDDRTGTRYTVASFIIHPNFNEDTFDYDIALLYLTRDIVFTDLVLPVCLGFKYTTSPIDYFAGRNVTILGWGTLFPGGPTARNLRMVDVPVITQQRCRATERITDRQICTFASGRDACQFDSGGPVMYTDPTNGLLFLIGLVSNGEFCATNRPGVQTRVVNPELMRWVVNNANSRFCVIR